MTNDPIVLEGMVLPGPSMTAPYVSDTRCVVWAAAPTAEQAARGDVLPFRLRSADGLETLVQAAGASARLPIRRSLAIQRASLTTKDENGSPILERESHVVGWLAAGEWATVEGQMVRTDAPFRATRVLQAIRLEVAGQPALRVAALSAGEPDDWVGYIQR